LKLSSDGVRDRTNQRVAFTPKGGCPLKLFVNHSFGFVVAFACVAFTPKGGCPLKLGIKTPRKVEMGAVAFTPKGGCPLKLDWAGFKPPPVQVAFTPKGGCPLKPTEWYDQLQSGRLSSIHPQGWVPIETPGGREHSRGLHRVAFTPKGGCPLKPSTNGASAHRACRSSIHPQGWVPIETLLGSARSS